MNAEFCSSNTTANPSTCNDPDKVLVIAYGNPLREDDGLGWHVAQALNHLKLEHLEIITRHQLMPELSETISQSRAVIFVDASVEVQAGETTVRELEMKLPTESFTHHLTPEHLLELTRVLYGRIPRAYLISVGISNLGYSEHLSPEVSVVIPRVLESILREIDTVKHLV